MSKFKSLRNFDMSRFGWKDCKFTFNALSWGEMRTLEKARQEWQGEADEVKIQKAAEQIVGIIKDKFVSGEALDDKDAKFQVAPEDFDEIPFDVFLKLVAWLVNGEVDEVFLGE